MIDMIAFLEARAGTVALQNTAGLADAHVTVNGDNITVPQQCNKILGVFAMSGVTAAAVPTNQIIVSSPSLRATSLLELASWQDNGIYAAATHMPGVSVVAAAAVVNPGIEIPCNDYKEAPIQLQPGEALQVLTATQAASAIENTVILITLTDGVLAQPIPGRIETVLADAVGAAVAFAWTPTAVVFRQALRAGTYAIVGMKAVGQSMIAARLVLGNQGARPGCLARGQGAAIVASMNHPDPCKGLYRYGRLGVWGTFTHTNPPTVEVLCSVADAAAVMDFAFDIIKIG